MTNREKYEKAFMDLFGLEKSELEGLQYQGIKQWDSVGHMDLITELEHAFDIMMDTTDIIDLSSFEKGMEILKENYDIEF